MTFATMGPGVRRDDGERRQVGTMVRAKVTIASPMDFVTHPG